MIALHVCGPHTNDGDGLGHGKTTSEIKTISCIVFHAHSFFQSSSTTAITTAVAAMAVLLATTAHDDERERDQSLMLLRITIATTSTP
jgi:SNF family Na+-dependent transporter